ncbi:nucleotidyltransferase family protein [Tomitella biformata]|uniref:nucleotidyltransferase family protein n=1 Tax=Tomitella biformata TaxID=630403 RepID=UPI0004BCA110|nr:nucleotidyltransferase family protein [Tomitella biformata]
MTFRHGVRTAAILLAAGRGSRFGQPKALVRIDGEPLIARAARALRGGGCDPVLAVIGAQAEDAATLTPSDATFVVAERWAEGIGESLRAGLTAAATLDPLPEAALIHLVDLPDVGPEAIARLLAQTGPDVLARAAYHGIPGHPVLLGRTHWPALLESVHGDRGAGPWLRAQPTVHLVECGDLATGADVDTADALRAMGFTS